MQLITKTPQARIVTMTKSIVDELDRMDTHNRLRKESAVRFYRDSIEQGRWYVTNQGIGVSTCGVVVDGGHRIQALIDAGYPSVEMLIVTGLNIEAQKYIDIHAKRTISDRLRLATGIATSHTSAGALRILSAIIRSDGQIDGTFAQAIARQVPIHECEDALDDYAVEFEVAKSIIGSSKVRSAVLAAFILYLKKDQQRASQFINSIVQNDRLRSGTAAHTAHRFIYLTKPGTGGQGQLDELSKVLSCCLADYKNQPMSKVYGVSCWK